MTLHAVDIIIFILFFMVVISLGLWKRRKDESSEGYFLAGRNLPWWIIGVSIVAANISTEQFVGMAGQSAGNIGLAVSGWQLIGAIAIILVAFFFLPRFLRAGIYTMPEYLEYRYSPLTRALMSFATVIIYACVTIVAVLYSGGLTLQTIFGIPLHYGIWGIALIAAIYTTWGGLSSVAWADLVQGGALLIGGLITFFIGLHAVNGWSSFVSHNAERLHMILPLDHPELPWAVLIGGMWIPNLYYTGLNQFIVQRTLAAKNLRQGQYGIIFAAALWLLVPFAIVMPGIISHQLYADQLTGTDQAYPMLIRNLIPIGLRGFIFAAISGAVISSLASMLNSASTIFTIDLYARYLNPKSSQHRQVKIGRIMTLVFLVIGCILAPFLIDPRFKGVFSFIQEFQGYISPGIVAVFIFGFIFKRAPALAGEAALLLSAPIYGLFHWLYASVPYLHRMLWTFAILNLIMLGITLLKPLKEPINLPVKQNYSTKIELSILIPGILVILLVLTFFIIFR
ncbi:sodium/solute symporter [candidate division KSB1 bacterium]|nr:sodium/solute symporter [candidate division KSB1 bacterium]